MSRQQDLAKNTAILTFGKICTQFISFLLLPLYTAILRPEEYGVADLIATYVTLLVPLFNWQFESGLFRFMLDCRGDRDQQRQLFTTVFVSNVVQSVFFIVLYLVVQYWITLEYKVFLAVDVVLNIFLNTMLQFPRGLGNNAAYAVGSFLSASTTVLFNVVFIVIFRMGVPGLFWAGIVGKLLTLVYLFVSQKTWQYLSLEACSANQLREMCRYSLPLVPNQLSWWVVSASNRTVISSFVSVAANGIYTVACKIPNLFIMFYNIFNMSWTESVALHVGDKDKDEYISQIINSMFRLFSSLCIGLLACMPFVFPVLINSQYAQAYTHIPPQMIAMLFQTVVGLYSAIYVALKKSKEIAKTSFFAAVINIAVDLALVGVIGLYAASISTLVAYAAMAIYRIVDVRKYAKIRLEGRVIWCTAVVCVLTLLTYYQSNLWLSAVNLLLVAVYAVYINRVFLRSAIQTVAVAVKKLVKRK